MIGTTIPWPQRFPRAVLLSCLAVACHGGGGGPANAKPTIIAASFVGSGPTPAPGDALLLTFSEAIGLVSGKLVTDADVVLSASGTLGNVTNPPTQLSTNTISVPLGAGVSFVPASTTITLRDAGNNSGNDAVRDGSGQLGIAGTPIVIGSSDGAPPVISNVTIDAIDGELNGTGPAGGVLQVPARGWTIDLAYSDNSAVATSATQIYASVAVATSAGSQPVGTNLVPFLTQLNANNTSASYLVPATVTFPNGPLTLSCTIIDATGRASTPATFAATVRAFTQALQPFETNSNPSQVWFLDFTRDIESYTTSPITNGVSVDVTAGANGRSDFEDLLRVLGLTNATPIANVQGSLDSNQVVIARLQQAMLAQLASYYAGVNVTFTLTQPGGSFGSNSSIPYNSFSFSRIAIAGSSDTAGVLGIAIFDPHNETQDDDTRLDFGGSRLGIFLHTIVDSGLGPPSSSQFRLTFDPFVPSLGGTPIGSDPNDGTRLTGSTVDVRSGDIDTAIADFAHFAATVTAHECGHSMGLVVNGAMPNGLYGNDPVHFPGSSDGHIRNASLFPPGATNIMSPALSYTSAIHAATAFNSLNRAYLRQQVLYGN
jgi:hypothetical protein